MWRHVKFSNLELFSLIFLVPYSAKLAISAKPANSRAGTTCCTSLSLLCLRNEWMVSYLLDTITGFGKMIHMSYKLRMIPLDLFAVRNVIMERRWPKYYWLCGQEEGSDIISANFLSLISWLFVCNRGDTIHEDKLWCTIALIYV